MLVTGASGFLGRNVLRALGDTPEVEVVAACRSAGNLPAGFGGEVRVGDLLDPGYRRDVVAGIGVVCHAASSASMWGHGPLESERFLAPTQDLIDQAIGAGVRRFVQTSTVAVGRVGRDGGPHGDADPTERTGYWPHLDRLIEIDRYMEAHSGRGTQMVTLRLGHFVGAGNRLGLLPALLPRLRTHLVPWLARGRSRLPLVADTDLGRAFALAAVAGELADYESFNICGPDFPTLREVVEFVATETGLPRPHFSVPYPAGYAFGWLMEKLNPVLPGSSPFLTRSIVRLAEDWVCPGDAAEKKLGYVPQGDWRSAVRAQVAELRAEGYPWIPLSQL
ncbi:MAG TPA: NAD-dependent epimerase/dehydratase family protein [Acidimicrobiia bacterium]|nr:NAD-dependent epimerase/dehydratase family protein [Acidimicrobiia bacterium]